MNFVPPIELNEYSAADGACILVVEDDMAIRELLRALLQHESGYHVIEAADGVVALEMAARTPPDIVVLDQLRGSAPTLKALGAKHNPTGQGWSNPGDDYGARVAMVAQRLMAIQG